MNNQMFSGGATSRLSEQYPYGVPRDIEVAQHTMFPREVNESSYILERLQTENAELEIQSRCCRPDFFSKSVCVFGLSSASFIIFITLFTKTQSEEQMSGNFTLGD